MSYALIAWILVANFVLSKQPQNREIIDHEEEV